MVTHELERANQMNGIINVKKEAGMTSHDVVFKLRKILGTKKIGHGGTLDPDVVGVLPIAVGKATRMVEFMQDEGKSTRAKSLWDFLPRRKMPVGKSLSGRLWKHL